MVLKQSPRSAARLQLAQSAAARLSTGTKEFEHIEPVLDSLHWLAIHFTINLKIF